jgi:fido (protein-threonine AMPylation protein)
MIFTSACWTRSGDGRFRTTQRDIGIDYWLIPVELRQLLDDVRPWIEYKTYAPDEIVVRYHIDWF